MINKKSLALVSLLLVLMQGCTALPTKIQATFTGKIQPVATVTKPDFPRENEFKYILYHPRFVKGKKYRLILALHGAGESIENYAEIWKESALKNDTIVVTPQLGPGLFLFSATLDPYLFFDFTDYLKSKYPVDEKRVFIAGSSMGAATGTFLIQKRPDYWRGAVFVASIGLPVCFPGKSMENIINLNEFPPILYVMGAQDKVNYSTVVEGRDFLLQRGVRVELHSYENAGHEHRPEWNDSIFEWIKAVEAESPS